MDLSDKDITFKVIKSVIKKYSRYSDCIKQLGGRQVNFPEALSENIAKLILEAKYPNTDISWSKHPGDLTDSDGLKYEIKCFSSEGPLSFGPREKWDKLIIIDGRRYESNEFDVYEFPFSNESDNMKNIMVNKSESFSCQIKQGKRPRISFSNLMNQEIFKSKVVRIFSGKI